MAEDSGFSSRFILALHGAKISQSSPTRIAAEFNLRHYGKSISAQAVRKWLEGSTVPAPDKIVTLGRWLGVSPAWLLFGESAHPEVGEIGGHACSQPKLCGDFNRMTARHQEMVLEMIAIMLDRDMQSQLLHR